MPKRHATDAVAADVSLVIRRFRVIFGAVRSHFKQIEKQVGLGGAQVWALSVVRDHPGIGLGELARSMDVHQSTASNLVKGLQQKNLLRLDKGEVDKRQVRLLVQPKALALLAQVPGPFEGILPDALNQLPPATLAQLDRNLVELIGLLHADEAAGSIPLANL